MAAIPLDSLCWAIVLVRRGNESVKLRRSVSAWLIAGALLACLACTELPELLTLTDNPTNDFTVFFHSCDKNSPTVEVNWTAPPAITDAHRDAAHRDFVLGAAPAASAAAAPQKDLHALTSQWRL